MHEIVKINLDNEMDLILAHKRTMKLAELCGLTLASQTTFATAVSEIARCAISNGKKSYLVLSINPVRMNKKEIVASIFDEIDLRKENSSAFSYAKRLMGDFQTIQHGKLFETRLTHFINFSGTISDAKLKSFKEYFQNEPPISPYDEIRKKNIQLIDMANKLQESENQYRMLTDNLPLMMFAIDMKGEVSFSNKWLKDFSDKVPNSSRSSWQSFIHSDDIKNIQKDWEKAQVNKTTFRSQARLKDSMNNYTWHLVSIVPIKNDKDIINNWIGFFVDINSQKLNEETLKDNRDLKNAQKELEQKVRELNASNKNLEQFAFVASHDLQEPLRKISMFSNIIEMSAKLSGKNATYFNKINESSKRMSLLINDILNYSRLNQKATVYEETNLNILLGNVLAEMELKIHEKNAIISIPELPTLNVIPLQISQVFSNLIHNALKFSTGKPHITITSNELSHHEIASIEGLDTSKDYYHIKFEDNGIGFDQQFANKIFIIFQRLHDKSSYEGTGIGLALCKKIIENHQGIINAEGRENEGAVFNIYLPVL